MVHVLLNNIGATAVMCFSSGSGGMEIDAIKLADLLCNDCDIVLLCKEEGYIHQQCKEIKREYACEPVRFRSRTFSPSMLFKVRAILKSYEIKNVIFFGASELKTLYFAFLGNDLNVIVRHGTTKSTTKRGPVHQLVYSCVNYHVALSNHLLKNAKRIVPSGKRVQFRIITSSYTHNKKPDHDVSGNKGRCLKIIHVGRIAPGKGQVEAVLACAELDKLGVDFKLDFIGGVENDKYYKQLESVIDSSKLRKKVCLHGHVPNVNDYMAAADILLFPSYGEGMSNALIESLHYGLVCICFSNTVFPEFVEMGFYLVLANDRDQDDLSTRLLQVVENLCDEKSRSENNKVLAMRYFNSDRERNDWKRLLE